jgi:5'(3')-deoxyribonucleotidase
MFTASHNVQFTHHQRVNNWEEVLRYFKKVKEAALV